MRNLKKIVAVIMTVALLASMMVPALAAVQNEDKAQALQAIGLFKGTGSSFDLDLKLSREQGMALVVRALGAEATALAMSEAEIEAQLAKVADADSIATWARPYAAYMVKNDLTKGIGGAPAGQINYGAQLDLYADEFVILLLRAMGYPNVEKNNVWDLAVEAKLLTAGQAVSLKFNGTIIRDDVVGVLYNAVKSGVCADGNSLIGKLIASGAVDQAAAAAVGFAEAPKPVALAIESAVALNPLQIKVVFNKAVNADDAKEAAKYEVKDKGEDVKAVSNAAIEADGKSVVLTLAPTAPLTNNTNAKVTVAKDFRDAEGNKIPEAISFDKIAVADTTFPVFEKVEAVGLKTLRLFFSEPVTNVDASDFSIKSGSYTWTIQGTPKVNYTEKYVELTLGTNLLEGNVDVKVNTNSVFDFAGLMVFEKTITYTFAKVSSAPQVSIESAKPDEIKLKFDRPVYGTIKVSHGVKDYEAYTVTLNKSESNASDSWTFDFSSKKVPAGTITIFVFNDGDVKDLYGNKFEATSFSTTVVTDTTAPVVSETKVNGATSFEITFDEKIKLEEVKLANYSLKKADGTNVIIVVSHDGDKKVTIAPASGRFDDLTEYVLTIKKVADRNGNEAKDLVVTFKTDDNTNPDVKVSDSYTVNSEGKIYIVFSEAMNEAAMLNKANYMVSTNGSVAYKALGDKDTISRINEKTVLIDLNDTVANPKVLISANVTDLAGKKLVEDDLSKVFGPFDAETFKIDGAELIAKNTIKIKFDKELSQFDTADVRITAGVSTIAITAVESVSGKEVVVKIGTDLSTDAKLEGVATVSVAAVAAPNNTKTTNGTKLTGTLGADVEDKVAPEVTKTDDVYNVTMIITSSNGLVAKNADGHIYINFSENMAADSISKLSFTVGGYTVVSATANGKDVVIAVRANDDNTTAKPVVTQVYDITDANGNVFKAGGSWAVK